MHSAQSQWPLTVALPSSLGALEGQDLLCPNLLVSADVQSLFPVILVQPIHGSVEPDQEGSPGFWLLWLRIQQFLTDSVPATLNSIQIRRMLGKSLDDFAALLLQLLDVPLLP